MSRAKNVETKTTPAYTATTQEDQFGGIVTRVDVNGGEIVFALTGTPTEEEIRAHVDARTPGALRPK